MSDLPCGTSVAFPSASLIGCETLKYFLWVLSKIPTEVKPVNNGSSESLFVQTPKRDCANWEHSNQNTLGDSEVCC